MIKEGLPPFKPIVLPVQTYDRIKRKDLMNQRLMIQTDVNDARMLKGINIHSKGPHIQHHGKFMNTHLLCSTISSLPNVTSLESDKIKNEMLCVSSPNSQSGKEGSVRILQKIVHEIRSSNNKQIGGTHFNTAKLNSAMKPLKTNEPNKSSICTNNIYFDGINSSKRCIAANNNTMSKEQNRLTLYFDRKYIGSKIWDLEQILPHPGINDIQNDRYASSKMPINGQKVRRGDIKCLLHEKIHGGDQQSFPCQRNDERTKIITDAGVGDAAPISTRVASQVNCSTLAIGKEEEKRQISISRDKIGTIRSQSYRKIDDNRGITVLTDCNASKHISIARIKETKRGNKSPALTSTLKALSDFSNKSLYHHSHVCYQTRTRIILSSKHDDKKTTPLNVTSSLLLEPAEINLSCMPSGVLTLQKCAPENTHKQAYSLSLPPSCTISRDGYKLLSMLSTSSCPTSSSVSTIQHDGSCNVIHDKVKEESKVGSTGGNLKSKPREIASTKQRPKHARQCKFREKSHVNWYCSRCRTRHWVEGGRALQPFGAKHGFKFERIPEDGDCFYTCIYKALKADNSYLKQLNNIIKQRCVVFDETNVAQLYKEYKSMPSVSTMRQIVSAYAGQEQLQFYKMQAAANPKEKWLSFFKDRPQRRNYWKRDALSAENDCTTDVNNSKKHLSKKYEKRLETSLENEVNENKNLAPLKNKFGTDNFVTDKDISRAEYLNDGNINKSCADEETVKNVEGFGRMLNDSSFSKKRKRVMTNNHVETVEDLKEFIRREGRVHGSYNVLWADSFAHQKIADHFLICILFIDMERAKNAWPYRVLASSSLSQSIDNSPSNQNIHFDCQSEISDEKNPLRFVIMQRLKHGHFSLLTWKENEWSTKMSSFTLDSIPGAVKALWDL
mmetsp:Transcript_60007/g.70105  ORF Transcript_60007/g.70105 Transcript_60007/m.70105 type:complete len:898 (-) Transcript_60007:85-2778(-)